VSQACFRNPAAEIERLRSAGPVVEVQFPMIGKVWTTTTQELTDRVLKDSETFTIRTGTGGVAGLQWWMPRILRTLVNHMLAMDERATLSTKRFAAGRFWKWSRASSPSPMSFRPNSSTAMRGRCRYR
jgi:hypothetical protein